MTLHVAVDATPLLGQPTGVGEFTHGLLGALAERDDVVLTAYGLTWRGRGALTPAVPRRVAVARYPPMTLSTICLTSSIFLEPTNEDLTWTRPSESTLPTKNVGVPGMFRRSPSDRSPSTLCLALSLVRHIS